MNKDIQETRAKAKGAAKKTANALKGQTGIYATLAEEHGMVSSLMNQVLEGDAEVRVKLFPKIKTEILSHAHAEEQEFYSVLLNHPETRDKARHSLEEHREVESLIKTLDNMDFSTQSWLDTFERMRNKVEHHAAEEEKELFPIAKKVLDRQEASQLDDRFEQEKKRQVSAIAAAE